MNKFTVKDSMDLMNFIDQSTNLPHSLSLVLMFKVLKEFMTLMTLRLRTSRKRKIDWIRLEFKTPI